MPRVHFLGYRSDQLARGSKTLAFGARNLEVGMEGTDVSMLQSALIQKGHLDITTPTGYFGPLTKRALTAYQVEYNITPASGYFGPITRAHMSPASKRIVSTSQADELTVDTLLRLLLALEIIPPEKESLAHAALLSLDEA